MCGVIGIITSQGDESLGAAEQVAQGLMALQHRGQDAAGILSFDEARQKFCQIKDRGLATQVLGNVAHLPGNMAIGHTRYATVGDNGERDLQPLVNDGPDGASPVGMVHNGNLVNYPSLAEDISRQRQTPLQTGNDLELLMHLWCRGWKDAAQPAFQNCIQAAQNILLNAQGAYALVGLIPELGLIALRDPAGIRPLVLGQRPNAKGHPDICICSETGALRFLGHQYLREVAPGELLLVTPEGEIHSHKFKPRPPAHCMFEWAYFAGAEGSIEQRSVYSARLNLGHLLGRKIAPMIERGDFHPQVVCPVPDTGRTAAIALAETLRLPYREGLMKNRYIQRSFILETQAQRERAVELKLTPVESEVAGKNILLADDSLVRGTTGQRIVKRLKDYGAREVVLALSCPPIKHPCFYGIDFPHTSQLVASEKTPPQVAEHIGADGVVYLDEEDLPRAIGLANLCMACVNGHYPVGANHAEEFARQRYRRHHGRRE